LRKERMGIFEVHNPSEAACQEARWHKDCADEAGMLAAVIRIAKDGNPPPALGLGVFLCKEA